MLGIDRAVRDTGSLPLLSEAPDHNAPGHRPTPCALGVNSPAGDCRCAGTSTGQPATSAADTCALLHHHHQDDDRRTCRHTARPPFLTAPAPQPRPQSGRGGTDLEWPPGGGVTRHGRRGASARRRGCRGGRAWRRSGPGGRQQNLLAGLINIQSLMTKIASLQHDHLNRLDYDQGWKTSLMCHR